MKKKDIGSGNITIIVGNKRFEAVFPIGTPIFFLWKNLVLKRNVEGVYFKFKTFPDWDIAPEYESKLRYIVDIDGKHVKIDSKHCYESLNSLKNCLQLDKRWAL